MKKKTELILGHTVTTYSTSRQFDQDSCIQIAKTFPGYSLPENLKFSDAAGKKQVIPYGSFDLRMSSHDTNLWQKMFKSFFVVSDTRKSLGGDEGVIEYTAYIMQVTTSPAARGILLYENASAFGSDFKERARWNFPRNKKNYNIVFLVPKLENKRTNPVSVSVSQSGGFYHVNLSRYVISEGIK